MVTALRRLLQQQLQQKEELFAIWQKALDASVHRVEAND